MIVSSMSPRLGYGASKPLEMSQAVTTSASFQTMSRSCRTLFNSSTHTSHASHSSGESASSVCVSFS